MTLDELQKRLRGICDTFIDEMKESRDKFSRSIDTIQKESDGKMDEDVALGVVNAETNRMMRRIEEEFSDLS